MISGSDCYDFRFRRHKPVNQNPCYDEIGFLWENADKIRLTPVWCEINGSPAIYSSGQEEDVRKECKIRL